MQPMGRPCGEPRTDAANRWPGARRRDAGCRDTVFANAGPAYAIVNGRQSNPVRRLTMRTSNRSELYASHVSHVSLALLALALAGCASSAGLVNMWKDPEYGPAPLHKVYVIVAKKDPAHRRLTEDAFVSALTKRGISA